MNRIITTDVIDPNVLQPFTAKSLDFLQNSTAEQIEIVMAAIVGSSYSAAVPYILTGCVGSGTTYTSGYVLIFNEVCPIGAASVGANTPVQYSLVTTNDPTADPLTFTDSSVKNVHNIKTYNELTTAGTGAFTSAQFVRLDTRIVDTVISTFTTSAGTEQDITGATITTPSGTARKYKITLEGEIVATALTANVTGATIKLYNGATLLRTINCGGVSSDGAAYGHFPFSISSIADVPAGTVLKATITRNTSNNQQVVNAIFRTEWIS